MTRRKSPRTQGPEGRPLNVSPARKGWEIDPEEDPSAGGAALNRCVIRSTSTCLRQVEGEMTKQSLGAPFKPFFGLSGVVADPTLRSVSLGASDLPPCRGQVKGAMNDAKVDYGECKCLK
jgi:hypothetical protein